MKDSVYKESAPSSDSSSDDDLIVVKTEPCTIDPIKVSKKTRKNFPTGWGYGEVQEEVLETTLEVEAVVMFIEVAVVEIFLVEIFVIVAVVVVLYLEGEG